MELLAGAAPGARCLVQGAGCCAGCRVQRCLVLCWVPSATCSAGCSTQHQALRTAPGTLHVAPGTISQCANREARGIALACGWSMGIRRYEDFVAWRLANELKQNVYELVARTTARDDRRFCDQITDSAASAPRNLAEGFGCYRHPEFARYTRIAKASLVETHNHLGDGVDRGIGRLRTPSRCWN